MNLEDGQVPPTTTSGVFVVLAPFFARQVAIPIARPRDRSLVSTITFWEKQIICACRTWVTIRGVRSAACGPTMLRTHTQTNYTDYTDIWQWYTSWVILLRRTCAIRRGGVPVVDLPAILFAFLLWNNQAVQTHRRQEKNIKTAAADYARHSRLYDELTNSS